MTPIESAMNEKGLSIRELTTLCGIGRNATRRALRGEDVNVTTANRIATALGVHPLDIFEASGNGTKRICRTTPFVIPLPPTGRGVNPRFWENDYGTHPTAQAARNEANRLRRG